MQMRCFFHGKLSFLIALCEELLYYFIKALFQAFCTHGIFVKSKLPALFSAYENAIIIIFKRYYFILLAIRQHSIHSNACSTLGTMNFQRCELFTGSPILECTSCKLATWVSDQLLPLALFFYYESTDQALNTQCLQLLIALYIGIDQN